MAVGSVAGAWLGFARSGRRYGWRLKCALGGFVTQWRLSRASFIHVRSGLLYYCAEVRRYPIESSSGLHMGCIKVASDSPWLPQSAGWSPLAERIQISPHISKKYYYFSARKYQKIIFSWLKTESRKDAEKYLVPKKTKQNEKNETKRKKTKKKMQEFAFFVFFRLFSFRFFFFVFFRLVSFFFVFFRFLHLSDFPSFHSVSFGIFGMDSTRVTSWPIFFDYGSHKPAITRVICQR